MCPRGRLTPALLVLLERQGPTCTKTVCVEVTFEVLGQGSGVVYAVCASVQWILCGLPLGTVAATESHVECVLVTDAPVTTRPPWSNSGASHSCQFFCVY